VMPLTRLSPPSEEPSAPQLIPRLLHLDRPADGGLGSWVARVRGAAEACLVVDVDGRVAAISATCGRMLDVDPVPTVGVLLLDLVELVDFTVAGLPLADPEVQAPPLRALAGGGLTRGLVRLRRATGALSTYDVVGVPLAGSSGALAFFSEV
jgi:hypothetical protein